MKKLFLLALSLVVFGLLVFTIALLYQFKNKSREQFNRTKYGVSGYVPTNFPNSSLSDLKEYWKDINTYSQIYGIHVNWGEVDNAIQLSSNVKGDVYVLFGFQTPDDWENTQKVISSIDTLLQKRKNIKYIGIGNEINEIERKHPREFSKFKSEFEKISQHMRITHPEIGFFTTFQYDSLLGKAKLMNVKNKGNVGMVNEFKDNVDFVGYTVYPFLQYNDVTSIPSNYFSDLESISNIPYAITETSWPTQELNGSDFVFSESMQEQYIRKITDLPESDSLLFLNIVFLNDIVDWEKNGNTKDILFDSVGIRYNDGKEKSAFKVWSEFVTK